MSERINHISVVVIANNAEKTIKDCLNSLVLFEEVILYLNNSNDNTKIIASKFTNVNIFEGPFLGFGKTKQKAVSFTSNNWVFSLDADEVVDDILIKHLQSRRLEKNCVYRIKTRSFYKKKRIFYLERVPRNFLFKYLFNKRNNISLIFFCKNICYKQSVNLK